MRIHPERQIGSRLFTASCNDAVEVQARWLLDELQKMHDKGVSLLHNTRLRVGWSVITLRVFGGRVHLCEPQFDGDPLTGQIDDITHTLRVSADQLALVRTVGATAEPTLFLESIRVAPGALDTENIRLERTSLRPLGESGWTLRAEHGRVAERWTRIPSYELLKTHPAILQALMLPSDYRVSFKGDELVSVIDATDTECWAA